MRTCRFSLGLLEADQRELFIIRLSGDHSRVWLWGRPRWQLALPAQKPSVPYFTCTMGAVPHLCRGGPGRPVGPYNWECWLS